LLHSGGDIRLHINFNAKPPSIGFAVALSLNPVALSLNLALYSQCLLCPPVVDASSISPPSYKPEHCSLGPSRATPRNWLVFYILAAHPEFVYEAALCNCVNHCVGRQEIILEIKYFHSWWKITGPATRNDTIIVLPTTSITTDV
jgi:hypothetical protein